MYTSSSSISSSSSCAEITKSFNSPTNCPFHLLLLASPLDRIQNATYEFFLLLFQARISKKWSKFSECYIHCSIILICTGISELTL